MSNIVSVWRGDDLPADLPMFITETNYSQNETDAAQETASLTPKIGRARPLAERSVGTPDPGAISLALIVTAVGDVLGEPDGSA